MPTVARTEPNAPNTRPTRVGASSSQIHSRSRPSGFNPVCIRSTYRKFGANKSSSPLRQLLVCQDLVSGWHDFVQSLINGLITRKGCKQSVAHHRRPFIVALERRLEMGVFKGVQKNLM